jgi:hypothetical protein
MRVFSILFLFLSSVGLRAAEPALNKIGVPLVVATNCEIRWSDSATLSSPSATVYRVTPINFSPTVISNIMSLTGFSWRERKKFPGGWREGNALYFADADENRYLGFVPTFGYIYYNNSAAIAGPGQRVSGVPSEEKALQLALGIVDELGIDQSQLATRPNSDEPRYTRALRTMGQRDPSQGKLVTSVIARELFLIRTLGGVECNGVGFSGGIFLSFGNEGQLARLEMIWRNVSPARQEPVASREQLATWLRNGKCVIRSLETYDIRKLSITGITPYYFEYQAGVPQEYIYPYTSLQAEAEMPATNETIRICCPLLRPIEASR